MKRKYKILIVPILCMALIFGNCINAYAIENTNRPITIINGFKDSLENAVNKVQNDTFSFSDFTNVLKRGSDIVGMIYDPSTLSVSDVAGWLRSFSSGGHSFSIPENATDDEAIEEAVEYLNNNITFDTTNNNITFNDNSKNMYNYIFNSFVDSYKSYVYSLSLRDVSGLLSAQQYIRAQEIMSGDMSGSDLVNSVWMLQSPSSGYKYLAQISLLDYPYLIFKDQVTNNSPNEYGLLPVLPINGYTGETINLMNVYRWTTDNGGDWELLGNTQIAGATRKIGYYPNCQRGSDRAIYINLKSTQYRYHKGYSTPSASEVLYQPYYYNNDVYTSFSNSSGDYVVDSSNINTVTYGDTISYVDSFNTENGNPPSTINVNNYITQQNEQNLDNGNGGSGGSGDNGGGSGSDDSDLGIFDFLSRIGSVLGNLIQNLGNVLAELVEGIAEVVSSLFESIPTVFGDFLGGLLGWLPEELRALIILGISAMIIVGLIKMFKS